MTNSSDIFGKTFDFIVVGAGTAGCVLAARLSENGRHSVLLVEAGGEDRSPWIHIPLGGSRLFSDPRHSWLYGSDGGPHLGHRDLYQPRGKVIGGTGAINGMVYIRGNAADYDRWAREGCVGWGYSDVLPYFKKAERQERGADAFHSADGPQWVTDQRVPAGLADAFLEAAGAVGLPRNADFNGAEQLGVGRYQTTIYNGRRWSTAIAYLRPARRRANLEVVTRAPTCRILMEGRRATGLELRMPKGTGHVFARGEVILCGGTFNSPHLLQLSGIGSGALLQRHGVESHVDLPAVGENLRDHLTVGAVFKARRPVTLNDTTSGILRRTALMARYMVSRSGLLATNGIFVGGFHRSDPSQPRPDLQLTMLPWSGERTKAGLKLHPFSAFGINAVHLHPDARGSVRLNGPEPMAPPSIAYDFLATEYDRRAIVTGLKLCRAIGATSPLSDYVAEAFLPGGQCVSDDDLLTYCRDRAMSIYHPVGTCRMGRDATAVVDPRLKVKDVGSLRVVDASVMPDIVSGNTNAAVVMIAEKGADLILEDTASR